jgi:hypothetical protein
MVRVLLTPNLRRHVGLSEVEVAAGGPLAAVLERVWTAHPRLRGYVVDEHGALRHHMILFVDGKQIDRAELGAIPVRDGGEIYVMQALSGG